MTAAIWKYIPSVTSVRWLFTIPFNYIGQKFSVYFSINIGNTIIWPIPVAAESKGRLAHSMPCRQEFRMCLSHLIYVVRPCLIHTCHAHAMLRPCRSSQGHSTAVSRRPCCAVALRRTAWSEHGIGMASVNQTRPHCVNQMGKTHSKPLAAQHGRGTACYV